jgi:CheY-like chemotaxis protein
MLRNLGCEVTMVDTGAAAVAAASKADFDLAFLDVSMPGMNGYEATRAIRAAEGAAGGAPLPLVGLSAHALAEQREEGLRAGMDDFLTKPVAIATLRQALVRHARPTVDDEAPVAEASG